MSNQQGEIRKERIKNLQTDIEDWLDADAHSDRLPVKINFSDIEIIAENLAPTIDLLLQTKLLQERQNTIEEIITFVKNDEKFDTVAFGFDFDKGALVNYLIKSLDKNKKGNRKDRRI